MIKLTESQKKELIYAYRVYQRNYMQGLSPAFVFYLLLTSVHIKGTINMDAKTGKNRHRRKSKNGYPENDCNYLYSSGCQRRCIHQRSIELKREGIELRRRVGRTEKGNDREI